jgi:small subunit ribosomal protein S8
MTISDPIADMLTRVRNALMARHDSVLVPNSRVKLAIARILKKEGFIADFELLKSKPQSMIRVHLRYDDANKSIISGLERVSKPGLRVYVGRDEIARVQGGLGIAIVSTSQGVMTGQQAWRKGVGGELLCHVW